MSAVMESPGQGLSQITETTKISMEEEFLELTPSNIIKGLKNCKQVYFVSLIYIYLFIM